MSKSGLHSGSLGNLSLLHKDLFIITPPSSPLSTRELDNNIIDLDQVSPLAADSYEQLYRDAFNSQGQKVITSNLKTSTHKKSNLSSTVKTLSSLKTEKPKTRINAFHDNNQKNHPRKTGNSSLKVSNRREEPAYLGPYLLKQTRELLSLGENPKKVLEVGVRAMKAFENSRFQKPNLEYVMCLHIVAALYCSLGQYTEAIPLLERSIEIPNTGAGQKHSLAKFAGCMQLGDTYAMLGHVENSIFCYTAGLGIQRQVLGETDPIFGETCRYVAEAHVRAMEFDEAKRLCQMALNVHKANGSTASVEAAADRRLMGLICDAKGEYEAALEHYSLASIMMSAAGQDSDVAVITVCIGDAYLSLARYDKAVFTYQKALKTFKATKGDNHPSVATVFVRLAQLHYKMGKFRESKSYCLNALRIYENPMQGSSNDDIGNGFIEVAGIYESMNEVGAAVNLLKRALKVLSQDDGQLNTLAGVEAQMGVLYYMMGSYSDSYGYLKAAVSKLRVVAEKKSALFGIVLNQMGLACVQMELFYEAVEVFKEAKGVLEVEYGANHPNTIAVYSNLAGTYDAMGRYEEASEILEYVVRMRKEKLGTASSEVDDERRRLRQLLKDSGRDLSKKDMSLQFLLHD